MCFAYKITEKIEQIGITAYVDGDINTQQNAFINIDTIADNKWHYTCVDLYLGLLNSWATTAANYPTYRLTVLGVRICYFN